MLVHQRVFLLKWEIFPPCWEDHPSYHLVMTDVAMVKPWPIEIDGLPNLNMGIFHGYVKYPDDIYIYI